MPIANVKFSIGEGKADDFIHTNFKQTFFQVLYRILFNILTIFKN